MAKVAGYIKKINVDVGDRVKQGDLLATLEVPEMADDLTRATANRWPAATRKWHVPKTSSSARNRCTT